MFNPVRPVGMPPVTAPSPYGQQVGAPPMMPQAVQVPVQAQSGGGLVQVIKDLLTGIVNFFKRLFGGAAANPGAVVPPSPSGVGGDDAALATQFGLAPDAANVAAFKAVLANAKAEPGAIGPGFVGPDTVAELQQVLAHFGFAVPVTGQFDARTAEALMAWKASVGLTENFWFANGRPGTIPFVDARTKAKMIALLSAPPSGPAPTAINPVPVAPAPLPPVPVAPPPAPPVPVLPPPVAPSPVLPTPAPVIPTPALPTPTTPSPSQPQTPAPSGPLSAEEQKVAQEAGILPSKENVAKFLAAAAALEAEQGAVGPGLNDTRDTVLELQQVLNQFGATLAVTGTFDAPTTEAMLAFKRKNGLTMDYVMADGTPGVHPYVDSRTKQVMIKLLGG